jgi:hypothetical protein
MNCKKLLALSLCLVFMSCATAPPPEGKEPVKRSKAAATDGSEESLDEAAADPGTYTPQARTRYQTIQEGFDQATQMPTLNDFDPLDEPAPTLVCYSTKAADPDTVSEIVIKQMMVQINGVADYGPLFPGSLDHVETRLVIGKNNGWVNSQNLTNEIRQVFELARAPGSLVIKINENKFGIYQDIGAPAEVWLRKSSRHHIFFKVYKLDTERKRNEVFIGYCYHKGSNPEILPPPAPASTNP